MSGNVSRSPFQYLKRKQLIDPMRPGPTFDPCALLVHQYDTGHTSQKSRLAEGAPPPDRAELHDIDPPKS